MDRFSPQNGLTAVECAGGGSRECLTQTDVGRSCPVVSNGPPIVAESSSQVERSKLMEFNPLEIASRAVKNPEASSSLGAIKGGASMLSTIMKSLPMGKLDRTALEAVNSSFSDALNGELLAIHAEVNPVKSVSHLMMAGVIMNLRHVSRAVNSLMGLDRESLRRDELYTTEAADILSKSARAFSEADSVSARDVGESFRLFVPSLGSKQRIASQSTIFWSMTVAINGFFTARLLL